MLEIAHTLYAPIHIFGIVQFMLRSYICPDRQLINQIITYAHGKVHMILDGIRNYEAIKLCSVELFPFISVMFFSQLAFWPDYQKFTYLNLLYILYKKDRPNLFKNEICKC